MRGAGRTGKGELMAISREDAFGVFEDLLAEGLRPVLTGFRADGKATYWPKGSEGFFVYAHFESTQKLGALIDRFTRMDEIAQRHGLVAWFSGHEDDYDEARYDGEHHEYRVTFEEREKRRSGR